MWDWYLNWSCSGSDAVISQGFISPCTINAVNSVIQVIAPIVLAAALNKRRLGGINLHKTQWYVFIKIAFLIILTTVVSVELWFGGDPLLKFPAIMSLHAFAFIYLIYAIDLRRSKISLDTIQAYWLINIVIHGMSAWAYHLAGTKDSKIVSAIELALGVLCCLMMLLEWALPWQPIENIQDADLVSRALYSWLNPLLAKSARTRATHDDLPKLEPSFNVDAMAERFLENWQSTPHTPLGILICIIKTFLRDLVTLIFLRLISAVCDFIQPFVLELLIVFVNQYNEQTSPVDGPQSQSVSFGVYMSLLLLAASITSSLLLTVSQVYSYKIQIGLQGALYGALYRKAMHLSPKSREDHSISDIMNHLTVDTKQIVICFQALSEVIVAPVQILTCCACMYWFLGPYFTVGIVTILLLLPYNSYFTKKQHDEYAKSMEYTDGRTKLITSMISNIRSLKFHAWERPFYAKLAALRKTETRYFETLRTYNIPVEGIWDLQPFILAASTFSAYAIFGSRPLTAAVIFPSLSLFGLIKNPMALFPNAIASFVRAWVCFERLCDFFSSPSLEQFHIRPDSGQWSDESLQYSDVEPTVNINGDNPEIILQSATVAWNEAEDATIALQNINLSVAKGELCCIIGKVGSGKTAICKTICGLIPVHSGNLHVTKGKTIAYVSQSAWLRNQTIRDNIVFQSEYNQEWYDEVISACALTRDLELLPQGSNTMVGEKGVSLSGGQKARVSLARAIYSKADILVLDDVLSAVDEHVSSHIIRYVLSRDSGVSKEKTVILATNSLKVLNEATSVWALQNKTLTQCDRTIMEGAKNVPKSIENKQEADSPKHLSPPAQEAACEEVEYEEFGKVKKMVFWRYFKAAGLWNFFNANVLLFAVGVLSALSSVWLKFWADNGGESSSYYLGTYLFIGFAFAILNMAALYIFTVKFGVAGSRALHDTMSRSLLRSPMRFFETTPLGRILNRYTSDIAMTVDIEAMWVLVDISVTGFRMLFGFVVVLWSTPFVAVVFVPLTFVYSYYVKFYVESCRQLKRMESTSQSPVLSHFEDSMKGIDIISVSRCKYDFIDSSDVHSNRNIRAAFVSKAVDQWFLVRLQIIASILTFVTALAGIYMTTRHEMSGSLLGLAITNSLECMPRLLYFFQMCVRLERVGVSLERVMEYCDLQPEAAEIVEGNRPPAHWPARGAINFNNYAVRYREDLDLALRDINLSISSQEKVGVVGRTGAGKSTLTLALFRMVESAGGKLHIDDIDVSQIGLLDLRHHLSIIPQDAEIFAGSVRENLDPFNEHDDMELWQVLDLCHLKEHVQLLRGLDAELHDSGRNLSRGQAQLICLARALLDDSNILVLDEATGSVDPETDAIVQQTIRSEFKNKTIITIAHRLNTVMDSDRILVMDQGRIVENDTPKNLLGNPDSAFSKMLSQGSPSH